MAKPEKASEILGICVQDACCSPIRDPAGGREAPRHPTRRGGAARRQADRPRRAQGQGDRGPDPTTYGRVGTIARSRRCSSPDGTLRCIVGGPSFASISSWRASRTWPTYTELPDITRDAISSRNAAQPRLAVPKLLGYLPQAPRDGDGGQQSLDQTCWATSSRRRCGSRRPTSGDLEERDTTKRLRG